MSRISFAALRYPAVVILFSAMAALFSLSARPAAAEVCTGTARGITTFYCPSPGYICGTAPFLTCYEPGTLGETDPTNPNTACTDPGQEFRCASCNCGCPSGQILCDNTPPNPPEPQICQAPKTGSCPTGQTLDRCTGQCVGNIALMAAPFTNDADAKFASGSKITGAAWAGDSISVSSGGTGLSSMVVNGGLLYGSSTETLNTLSPGTNGQLLTLVNGTPAWQSAPAVGITVKEADGDPLIAGVTELQFDSGSGLNVTDLTGGKAKVALGSHYKTYDIWSGGASIGNVVAVGEDTLQVKAGSGISLTKSDCGTAGCGDSLTVTNSLVASGGTIGGAASVNGDLTAAGNINMATGKAIMLDGAAATNLNIGNWNSGSGAGFNLGVILPAGNASTYDDAFYLRKNGGSDVFAVNSSGAVKVGAWNASAIGLAYGGTNNSTYTNAKFLAYDGAKIASTAYDQGSFLTSGATVGGDLSGSLPNPAVAKINGAALGATTATAGNLLIGSGTQWVSKAVSGVVSLAQDGTTSIGAGKIANSMLASSSVTVSAGTGLSGGGSVALGGTATLTLSTPVSIANGGTNNSSFTSGKFLAYDGARLVSTTYDQNSFGGLSGTAGKVAKFTGTGTTLGDSVIAESGGNIGIGDSSPFSLLTVGSGDKFQVDSNGNLVRINNVAYSWPAAVGAASTYLKTDAGGNLSWATASGAVTQVSGSGAGISVSPTTGNVVVSNTGVTSLAAGTGISLSGATGAVTISNTFVDTDTLTTVTGRGATTSTHAYFNGGLDTSGFKLTSGASNNYVLTSDASGNGTWKAAPSYVLNSTWKDCTFAVGTAATWKFCTCPAGYKVTGWAGYNCKSNGGDWECSSTGSYGSDAIQFYHDGAANAYVSVQCMKLN